MTTNILLVQIDHAMREEYWHDDAILLFSDWSIPNLNDQADSQVTCKAQYVHAYNGMIVKIINVECLQTFKKFPIVICRKTLH